MKKLLTALFSACVLLSAQAQANIWFGGSGTLIKSIDIRNGFLKIEFEDSYPADNDQGCSSQDRNYIMIDSSDQLLYSAVLSAYMGGKKISYGTNACVTNWAPEGTFPKAYAIVLR